MSTISHRHWGRQLRHAQRTAHVARTACTEARQQLAELRARSQASTAQAAALLQTMTTAILAENQDHRITLINQRMCDLFELPHPPAYYIGKSAIRLLRGAGQVLEAAAVRHENQQLIAAQERSSGLLIRLQDGRIMQQDYLPVVQNGLTVLHIWSYEDVTQQQAALHRVQELSRLAEQSPQPIIRFSQAGKALYSNPAAAP